VARGALMQQPPIIFTATPDHGRRGRHHARSYRLGGVAVRGTILTSCVVALALIGATLGAAHAQEGRPTPLPITSVPADTVLAASYAAFDLGTNYLYNSSGQGGLAGLAH